MPDGEEHSSAWASIARTTARSVARWRRLPQEASGRIRRSRLVPSVLWFGARALAPVASRGAGRLASLLWGIPWGTAGRTDVQPQDLGELVAALPQAYEQWIALRLSPTPGLPASTRRIRLVGAGDGPTVLLAHGWGGTAAHFGPLMTSLCRQGFHVVAMQLPSHGSGNGLRVDGFQVAEAIRRVADGIDACHVVGHSFGAFSTLFALRQGLDIDRVALVAPCVSIGDARDSFLAKVPLPARVVEALNQSIDRDYGPAIWDDLDFVQRPPEGDRPVLIIHDEDDARLPIESSRRLAAAIGGARMVETRELGHRGVVTDESIVRQITEFLGESL